MKGFVTVHLQDNHVGQLLDGLEVLIEQWEATREYHVNGGFTEDV